MRTLVMPLIAAATVCASTSLATAQPLTLRFDTNVGSFDMELNPTGDPNLQGHVDNILGYVGLGRYNFTAINRAPEGFVLQMGSFLAFPGGPDIDVPTFTPIDSFDPVIVDADNNGQVDFNTLSNTRGRVSLALSAGNPNSGNSSFFINLGSNTGLDAQGFVPFARIVDMSPIDTIMSLNQRDLSNDLGSPGSLAFIDVPITDDNRFVIINDVSVVNPPAGFSFVEPILRALGVESQQAAAAISDGGGGGGPNISVVPEPSAALLTWIGTTCLAMRRRRR